MGRTQLAKHGLRRKRTSRGFEPGRRNPDTDNIDLATTKNVKWVARLGNQTYGSPVVAAGKVFVGTNNEAPRDPRIEGDRGVMMCFDEKTGDSSGNWSSPSWTKSNGPTGIMWELRRRRRSRTTGRTWSATGAK